MLYRFLNPSEYQLEQLSTNRYTTSITYIGHKNFRIFLSTKNPISYSHTVEMSGPANELKGSINEMIGYAKQMLETI